MKRTSKTSILFPILIFLALLEASATQGSAQSALGLFEGQNDVGNVFKPGSAKYDSISQTYNITGAGKNMWFTNDEFHVVWKKLKGDFILNTTAQLIDKGVDPHRKLGWIVRSSLATDSAHVNAAVHGDGLTSLQFRRATGAKTEEARSTLKGAEIIQLERKGNKFTMNVAKSGETFTATQIEDLNLGDEVYAGLFVCSHNTNVYETGVFRNVRVITPARDGFVPYKEYIGSRLETMEILTGTRKVLFTATNSIQAPNWTPDGKTLIYNTGGRLMKFDLTEGKPSEIDTGFANRNNNDHALSFDGRTLAISHHNKDDGGKSIVFTVPVAGGIPSRVTATGPSYLHGWSPDGTTLTFTGQRDGEFDIYSIPAGGGQETRLTTAKGLDDGSEYSPDGKSIYFCSTRTGRMQLWKMKTDGSDQKQLTDDEFNNWFPHVSPDGKWIAFLSFSKEIAPDDHPFYKQVYLRLMPAEGGPAKVIAYVYGGQGTINVNSWSPDSRSIAFVSNSGPN